ncbi:serine/threonine protein kinase [Candidatus Bathyarchaeota archaeon]|nr:serine/threonine protein kinase [Candidatus Bathyarchaeota archaeon]
MNSNVVISLEDLYKVKQGQVLCYPRYEEAEIKKRLKELEKLGVQAIEFIGKKSVFDVPVLGKGCVGIVVIAHVNLEKFALKIRRIDSDRKEMFNEGRMLKRANLIGVGPKLIQISENFLLMKLVKGTLFPEWLDSLKDKMNLNFNLVLRNVLEQCYRLDEAGLDHGELSRAPKHIIVDSKNIPHLIDFETASINRRMSNVTSISQYFFLRSNISNKVKKRLKEFEEKELINALRNYKQKRTRQNFEKILKIIL